MVRVLGVDWWESKKMGWSKWFCQVHQEIGSEEQRAWWPMQDKEFKRLHEVFKSFGGSHSLSIWKFREALINIQFHMIASRIDEMSLRSHSCAWRQNFWIEATMYRMRGMPLGWYVGNKFQLRFLCAVVYHFGTTLLGMLLAIETECNGFTICFCFFRWNCISFWWFESEQRISTINFWSEGLATWRSGGLLGSHSIHKFASTHVWQCRISKDDNNTRDIGKEREKEFQINMMIWNCRIPTTKWQKSHVLVDRVSMWSTTLFEVTQIFWQHLFKWRWFQVFNEDFLISSNCFGKAALWVDHTSVCLQF